MREKDTEVDGLDVPEAARPRGPRLRRRWLDSVGGAAEAAAAAAAACFCARRLAMVVLRDSWGSGGMVESGVGCRLVLSEVAVSETGWCLDVESAVEPVEAEWTDALDGRRGEFTSGGRSCRGAVMDAESSYVKVGVPRSLESGESLRTVEVGADLFEGMSSRVRARLCRSLSFGSFLTIV